MQKSEYKNIYKNESSHFYYVGFHKIILSQLEENLKNNKKPVKILDAGCGTGLLAKKMSRFGQVTGIDLSEEAIKYAKRRGINVKKASVTKTKFPNESFDVVVSIDVIYHKWVDDKKAIKEFIRVLKPGGILILKLPAFEFLRRNHDLVVYTKKRYTKKDVIKLLGNKVSITKVTYLASFLLPLVTIKSLAERLIVNTKPNSSVGKIWQPLNKLLLTIFYMEGLLLKFTNIPFGISILAIGKNKK